MLTEYKYTPTPASDLLEEMKDLSLLAIDLAYSSLLYQDPDLKEEVIRVERKIDMLSYNLKVHVMLAVRDVNDAKVSLSLLEVAQAVDNIPNAAADIATRIKTTDRFRVVFRKLLRQADERVMCFKLSEDQATRYRIVDDFDGMDVIAIEREDQWYLNPEKNVKVKKGDILLVRGPQSAIKSLLKTTQTIIENGERNVEEAEHHGNEAADGDVILSEEEENMLKALLLLKNKSELMIDLAFGALLTGNKELAEEVERLEELSDKALEAIENHFILWAIPSEEERRDMLSYLQLGQLMETIGDAALLMVTPVLSGIEGHPLIASIVRESDEHVLLVEVDPSSLAVDKTVGEIEKFITGIWIQAIRRNDTYFFDPPENLPIQPNDHLIIKVYSEEINDVRQFFGKQHIHYSE